MHAGNHLANNTDISKTGFSGNHINNLPTGNQNIKTCRPTRGCNRTITQMAVVEIIWLTGTHIHLAA